MKTILLSLLLSCCTLLGSVVPCAPGSSCPADAAVPESNPAAAETAVCESEPAEASDACPADECAPAEDAACVEAEQTEAPCPAAPAPAAEDEGEAEPPCEKAEACEPACPDAEDCQKEPAPACSGADTAACEAETPCESGSACDPQGNDSRCRRSLTFEEILNILLGGCMSRQPADAAENAQPECPAAEPTAPQESSREEVSREEASQEVSPEAPAAEASRPEEPREPSEAPKAEVGAERAEVFQITNQERQNNGLPALEYRADLQTAADLRAKEIVQYFSHTRPNGTSCFTVVSEAGVSYRALGENIAYGQRSAAEVMNGWMNSSGHRANILSSNFTGMAVGFYQTGGVKYWVQIFIR